MDQAVTIGPERAGGPKRADGATNGDNAGGAKNAPAMPSVDFPFPRIYYIHPLQAGPLSLWPALLDQAAAAGYTHVLTAPIFAGPSVLLAADFAVAHPTLAWEGDGDSALVHIAAMCRARGLTPMLDVVLGEVAAEGRIASENATVFVAPRVGPALDPRRFGGGTEAARPHADGRGLAAFWSARLRLWQDLGLGGFRLLLGRIPAEVIEAITASLGGSALLIGWTPGLDAKSVAALRGRGLDFVCASLPWWDFEADWFWTELDRLRAVARVMAPVEAPFGPRLAARHADPALLEPARARAVAFAAAVGDGVLVPMGFDEGATRAADPRHDLTLAARVAVLPDMPRTPVGTSPSAGVARLLTGPDAPCIAVLRTGTDTRYADRATLAVVNVDLTRRHAPVLADLLGPLGGRFAAEGMTLAAPLDLAPGDGLSIVLQSVMPATVAGTDLARSALAAARGGRIGIERVSPAVEDGRFPAKRLAGEIVIVEADVIFDGHDKFAAALLYRNAAETEYRQVRMRHVENDRWAASLPLDRIGRFFFRIEAWRDAFASFRDELSKKHAAGVNVEVELIEGRHLVADAGRALAETSEALKALDVTGQVALLLSADVATAMAQADRRPGAVRTPTEYTIEADRAEAEFASWYEIFPRSMSDDPNRHGTFADVERHLPRIRDMGFDVLYFPPIHPIGRMNRKGRNNTLTPTPDDPGSPYAIGGPDGGHDAIHPQLGSFGDFQHMREAAARHGLEIALDFAIQCSPDHPWLQQHKGWFAWRPDGSMKFAENPPKKYEDIVNVDFYAEDAIPGLWVGLAEVVLFWAEQGVRIFRVDNPHTKAFPFWEWMIAEVRARFPDTLFFAEAFTRPKVMNRLGKIGFSQSYTYFTWRNTRRELEQYLTELTTTDQRDFFRPNFFVNTPDINPVYLQTGGRAAHLIRAALAATLSGLWGVYSGFELCEATPLPGREEYLDSEKYQIRAWDWERAGNIVAEITRLNHIRRHNPALRTHLGVSFLPSDNDQIIVYEKATPDRHNVVLVAVSLDPFGSQTSNLELPLYKWNAPDRATLSVADLVRDTSFDWIGKFQRVTLDPSAPYAILRLRPRAL